MTSELDETVRKYRDQMAQEVGITLAPSDPTPSEPGRRTPTEKALDQMAESTGIKLTGRDQ